MSKKENKVVFILGAGFSSPALDFGQASLLAKMDELSKIDTELKKLSKKPFSFIKEVYGGICYVPLEDVYTALDRSIDSQISIKSYATSDLAQIRDNLNESIVKTFYLAEKEENNTDYIQKFVEKLCHYRKKVYREKQKDDKYGPDRLALISLNWDSMLDRELGRCLTKNYRRQKRRVQKGDMFFDYCMFDFKTKRHSIVPPSLRMKPLGLINLKYLKLHGSINWFHCPNCDGLLVNLERPSKEMFLKESEKYCHVCEKNFSTEIMEKDHSAIQLNRYFVSPTFLKDFSSTHFRSIWWNAGYELIEATKVVFIGYSLPLADYDLKYLMAKNLSKDANIQVVLSNEATDFKQCCDNYRNYFGNRIKANSIYCHGVESYVDELNFDKTFEM
jgi:hypothetical protein